MRLVVVAGWAIFAGCALWLILSGHPVVPVAAEGAIGVSVLGTALTAAVAMIVARRVSPIPLERVEPPDRARLTRQSWLLLGVSLITPAVFAVLVALGQAQSLGWVAKLVLFFALPLTALALTGGIRVPVSRPPARWRWLGPLPAMAGFLLLYHGTFGVPEGLERGDPLRLVIGVLLVFLTASVGEEVFYRWLLQTRLELLLGRWPAILASALLFALMHLPTRLPVLGDAGYALAAVIAIQGAFGLVAGYLWSRFRNLWAVIALHAGVNHLSLLWLL
ncbi:CPBP family intramembrane metalloprotease [Crossiella sp. SN42]|uniref:CPBP family intramembrane glutamic endopeptidase n=1 Tax=Crossiella sp. SN42 TaxID=2944808 RepID=UPI00207CCDA7|nr:type II CAAX endopeptidase family protein [Crossiella sp. SN42]MCO1577069.1 CPBP family intramembrane metalloprotease [Crossiella sp. SN42]